MGLEQIATRNARIAVPLMALILANAGCAPDPAQPQATLPSQSSWTTTTNPVNFDFPDLADFALADAAHYDQMNKPRSQGFMFLAPTGLICASNAYPDDIFERVSCRGQLPQKGSGDWSVTAGRDLAGMVKSITGDPDLQRDRANPPPALMPMHKLTATKGDAVCAVDDKGMTACHIGDHGFVITPTSTRLF
ncbi:hypothetical protein [Mycolicibacterium mucogenicum]|uniref:hypothetical protein n=1 Tax=Mycolicibacterium mucogenicum TaxID=56689 RepID=UPI000AB90AE7|nr:hypothetical protein [Mycolicibacterium mucogenicum]